MRISDWSSDVCSSDLYLGSCFPRRVPYRRSPGKRSAPGALDAARAPGAAFGLTRSTCGAPVVNSRHGECTEEDPLQDEAAAPGEPEGRRMEIGRAHV